MTRVLRITDASTRALRVAFTEAGLFELWLDANTPIGWTKVSTPTVTQSTSNVKAGIYSARLQSGSLRFDADLAELAMNNGDTVYVRCWVYVVSGAHRLYGEPYAAGTPSTNYAETVGTGWQQLIVQTTANASGIVILLQNVSGDAYWDLVQTASVHTEWIEGQLSTAFRITNWEQNIIDEKGGGYFSGSSLSEGEEYIGGVWGIGEQVIDFNMLEGASQNALIADYRRAIYATQQARLYGSTNQQPDVVYIEAKAENETEYRYARIIKATLPSISDVYDIVFAQTALTDLSMNIRHAHWQELPLGVGLNIPITIEPIDTSGIDYEPVVGNAFRPLTITNIHITTAGGNLVGSGIPYNVIGATGETYFGINTDGTMPAHPFNNIVFDLSTAAAGTYTLAYEYWNGSAWTALNNAAFEISSPADFKNAGRVVLSWEQPEDWAENTPGGSLPTCFWMRVRVASGSLSTQPVQQNNDPYSPTVPYVEIDYSDVGGDIAALAKIEAGVSYYDRNMRDVLRMLIGLKSSKFSNYYPFYINLSEEHDTGTSITYPQVIVDGVHANFADESFSPVGRAVTYQPASSHSRTNIIACTITPASDLQASSFNGRYRAFARVRQETGTVGQHKFDLQVSFGNQTFISDTAVTKIKNNSMAIAEVLDFGELIIGFEKIRFGESSDTLFIGVYAEAEASLSSPGIWIYDIVLIPVDEWMADIAISFDGGGNMGLRSIITADSIDHPKYNHRAYAQQGNRLTHMLQMSANGPVIAQNNQTQRYWFFSMSWDSTNSAWVAMFEPCYHIRVKKVNRYLSLRGAS